MTDWTDDPLDRTRYPIDEWALVETTWSAVDAGRTETLFTVGNGYLGLRGNFDEADEGFVHGTFVNAFHETWPIRHAEEAYGFAHVGQTIVNVPDPKGIRLFVDDEPLVLSTAELLSYERRLDFKSGCLTRELVWRTALGKHVRIRSRRMVSFVQRHLASIEYEVTALDQDASIVLSSHLINRQDRADERHRDEPPPTGFDPRKAEELAGRVLEPGYRKVEGERLTLGYTTASSRMTIACAIDHELQTVNAVEASHTVTDDIAVQVYRVRARAGEPVRLSKFAVFHTSPNQPLEELAAQCDRTLETARELGVARLLREQREWLDGFWERSDVEIPGRPALQQAVRWNLLQVAQAAARADGFGIPAKGLSGSGYGGHYFWDTEVYVLPFLTYTSPVAARNALRFRALILDLARMRATELSQRGALFPWRTINGLESSAYYAAGTAQYHIDADIAHAVVQYEAASGDTVFFDISGIDILVETARLWADLGFWRVSSGEVFHIHGVTGPDEYTTVVNDNLYTNVMARANLRDAVAAVDELRRRSPENYERMVKRLDLADAEVAEWARAAGAMHIPFDVSLGIHPQDAQFLEHELWDLENTPPEKRPLLLHYHPLVIYRFQVLKQADVVLALILQGDQFTAEEKLADFDYYDPLTTGDSTLSAVAQSIIAAEVGYQELALRYFTAALFVDLADLKDNAADGVHVASAGGVWSALTFGFGGMRDHGGVISFDPRLPPGWQALKFRMTLHGSRILVELRRKTLSLTVETGRGAEIVVRGERYVVIPEAPVIVELADQGPRRALLPSAHAIEGELRPDGSIMTSSIPAVSSTDPLPSTITTPIDIDAVRVAQEGMTSSSAGTD